MTDRKDALVELLTKVEAGWYSYDIESTVRVMFPNDIGFRLTSEASRILNAYNGSLDAAKALHEAVLPEWLAVIDTDGAVEVSRGGWPADATVTDNPARAWLIAILKALIAGENTNDNDKGE
jgi:hypothetical protein